MDNTEESWFSDEMVGCHRQLNEHESEQILGDTEGQGRLCAAVHRVAKNQTQLSDGTTTTITEESTANHTCFGKQMGI